MQELNRYEYSVVRFVPDIEREEFINVGLAMMCKRKRWIKVCIDLCESRIRAFAPECDIERLSHQLQAFVDIAAGMKGAGPVAQYPMEERFRWLTAVKSTVIQTSRPHPGLTPDLDSAFERLFATLVK